GVAQRLSQMALGVEFEILVELLKLPAKNRNFLGRNAQRFAGPQARMDTDRLDLSLAERHHHEIERNAAVDRRAALGLGHQRLIAATFEVTHGAETAALIGRRAGNAKDPQRLRR